MYITRKLASDLQVWLEAEDHPNIAIIAGVVGCGKTTLVDHFLQSPSVHRSREVFKFSLDDITLRRDIAADTNFFVSHIASRAGSRKKVLCFVDEVQKSEAVFDAIKLAWDQGIDFIISGSNPEYLTTQASMRLQRRSLLLDMKPLSLVEILNHRGLLGSKFSLYDHEQIFFSFLNGSISVGELQKYLESLELSPLSEISTVCSAYLFKGGLPKAFLAKSLNHSFSHIQACVERGFAPILQDTLDIFDIVTVELARGSSQEFSYENFFQRTRTRNREKINLVISRLAAHGYINEKRPYIPDGKSSYFVTYSFIDPGMIAYLTDTTEPDPEWEGSAIESYVHGRLDNILKLQPRKATLAYFKPYTLKEIGAKTELRFRPGEIDFVVYFGAVGARKAVGLEVKRQVDGAGLSLDTLQDALNKKLIKRGITLYGGMPRIAANQNIVFWPWWLI